MEQTAEKVNGNAEVKDVVVASRKGDGHSSGAASGTVTLGPRDRLDGKLTIESHLVIQGHVEGELVTTGDVTVESGANVKARLECRNISVLGDVEGDVTASKRLVLAGGGKLHGKVTVAKLQVEDGATFNGSITMTGA